MKDMTKICVVRDNLSQRLCLDGSKKNDMNGINVNLSDLNQQVQVGHRRNSICSSRVTGINNMSIIKQMFRTSRFIMLAM